MAGWIALDSLVPALLAGSIRGALVLALGAAAAIALRRGSAAVRHLVWSLALAGSVAVPVLAAFVPSYRLRVPAAWSVGRGAVTSFPAAAVLVMEPPAALPAAALETTATALIAHDDRAFAARPVSTPSDASTRRPVVSRSAVAFAVWAAGGLLTLATTGLGLISLQRLGRRAKPIEDGPAARVLAELTVALGVRTPVRLLTSGARSMPMTWGIVHPVILLPANAERWNDERLRVVLAHELAHVQRGDCLTRLLARCVRALYWFNPLAWVAESRLRAEQERASDDVALGFSMTPWAYAEHLLEITAGAGAAQLGLAFAPAMAGLRRIEDRLRSVLDVGRDRRPARRRHAWLGAVAMIAVAAPLSAASVVLADPPNAKAAPDADQRAASELPADQAALLAKVREIYVRPPDEAKLNDGAIKGMIAALGDPFSSYIPPDRFAQLEKALAGKLIGVGAKLELKGDAIRVVAPLDGSPALKAGVQRGDLIVEIDGKPAGADVSAAAARITGPAGSVVTLKVKHENGRDETLKITRGPIELPTVVGARGSAAKAENLMLDPAHKVGYARITQFGSETPKELEAAIRASRADGLKGLVLDLRACPGGMLNSVVDVAGLLLAKGPVVTVRGRGDKSKSFDVDGKNPLPDFPLAVLIDEHTASAAEILAGCLKESGRAILVGNRTFGKGTVQEIIPLKGGAAVRLTTAYFFTPGGRKIDKQAGEALWGVDPTEGYYVALSRDQAATVRERFETGAVIAPEQGAQEVTPERIERDLADPQLAAALKTMLAKLATGEFARTGRPLPDFSAQVMRPEDVEKRRAVLLKDLEKLTHDLDELERGSTSSDKGGD